MAITLTSLPDNYASALSGELVYSFTGQFLLITGNTTFTVMDNRTSAKIGAKLIPNTLFPADINIAPMALSVFDPKPLSQLSGGFVENSPLTACVTLQYGNYATPERVFTLADRLLNPAELLSTLPRSRRTIMPDGRDEISLTADKNSSLRCTVVMKGDSGSVEKEYTFTTSQDNIYTMSVCMGELMDFAQERGIDDITDMEISLYVNGTLLNSIRYEVCRPTEDRISLAWLNSLGAIEYHAFEVVLLRSATRAMLGSCALTELLPVQNRCSTTIKLSAGVCTRSDREALAEIIASPKVWRINSDGYYPVEVATDTVITLSDTAEPLVITIKEPYIKESTLY